MSTPKHDAVLDVPCQCGSGKPYRDCHLSPPAAQVTVVERKWSPPAPYVDSWGQTWTSSSAPGMYPDPARMVHEATETHASPAQPAETQKCSAVETEETPRPRVELTRPPVTRKLDLACGQTPRDGFEGVDIFPGAQHVVNLLDFPWEFETESVAELHCSHFVEHIPMTFVLSGVGGYSHSVVPGVSPSGSGVITADPASTGMLWKDALFAFFDECWRILVPDGWMQVIVPSHRSDRAFQDPTHRRFITPQTFVYLNQEWRRLNRLDHYNVECNFAVECVPTIPAELNLKNPAVVANHIQNYWNTTVDWVARLQKKPRS